MFPSKAKVLVFDIETSPILAFVWDLWDQNIALNQIVKDRHVISFSAIWLDDPANKIIHFDNRGKKWGDDKELCRKLWKLLDEADIVITQNGKKFDTPRMNARFLIHGFKPPSPYTHLDTYQIAKGVFDFPSKKLEYMTSAVNKKYKKLLHKKFPGQLLWNACMAGVVAAWDEMHLYNDHDVLSTRELYMLMRAWTPTSMPNIFTVSDKKYECSTCGVKNKMDTVKPKRMNSGMYYQFRCRSCGAFQKGKKVKQCKISH